MANLSTFIAARLMSLLYKNNAAGLVTPGDAIYVALFTADTGLNANAPTAEVTGTGYARQQVTAANWVDNADGTVHNGIIVDFGDAGGAWGTVTHAATMSALSGGNVYHWGPVATPRNIVLNDPVSYPIGALVLGLT